jgi:hypothetical protein
MCKQKNWGMPQLDDSISFETKMDIWVIYLNQALSFLS